MVTEPGLLPGQAVDRHRLRWNPRVLGLAAASLGGHGDRAGGAADPAWGVEPTAAGNHLRWSIDPLRGFPAGGFYLFRRPTAAYAEEQPRRLDLTAAGSAGPALALSLSVAGERRPLELRHPGGVEVTRRGGAALPAGPGELAVRLPTSGRQVTLALANVPSGAEVRAWHSGRLVAVERAPAGADAWPVTVVDVADELTVAAPGASLTELSYCRVPGDLVGWEPLARVPPLGLAPLHPEGIAARLDAAGLPAEGRDRAVAGLLEAARAGGLEDLPGTGLALDRAALLPLLSLLPRVAWAFGLYHVDSSAPAEAVDYLAVAAYGRWREDRLLGPTSPDPELLAADRQDGEVPAPAVPGGPSLGELLALLAGEEGGVLYLAPAYAVSPARSDPPAAPHLDRLAAAGARVEPAPGGGRELRCELRAAWSARGPAGDPPLARQLAPLAAVTVAGPGDASSRLLVAAGPAGEGDLREELRVPYESLPATVTVTVAALDPFGRQGPPARGEVELTADLQAPPPPPVEVAAELAAPEPWDQEGDVVLSLRWRWEDGLALRYPGARGVDVEYLLEGEAARGGPAPWRPLPRLDVAPGGDGPEPPGGTCAGLRLPPPTGAEPVRRVWVRLRTVDGLGRAGPPSSPTAATWVKPAPAAPEGPPVLARSSPPDAFGRCRLLLRFEGTLAHHAYLLERAPATDGEPPDELFEPRGRMLVAGAPAPAGEGWVPADGVPVELEDVVDGPGQVYAYRVRALDRAGQVGPPSPAAEGRGLDVLPPDPPQLLDPLVTPFLLAVRWAPHPDPRVRGYRVTRLGDPGPVAEGPPELYRSLLRIEGDQVDLPPPPEGASYELSSLRVAGDPTERITEGYLTPPLDNRGQAPAGRRFVLWYAQGSRALVVTEPTEAAASLRDRVPERYAEGIPEASSVNPVPLRLAGGVLDGAGLDLVAEDVAGVALLTPGGELLDQAPAGTWIGGPFLVSPDLEEGEEVVVELRGAEGPPRTFGRCPAAPGLEPLAVRQGAVRLPEEAAAGSRVTGLFRAREVTAAGADGRPDPRSSGAPDLAAGARAYRCGFVRRVRDGVPVVVRFTGPGGEERLLATQPGGEPLAFRAGILDLPPWDPERERLSGVFERAQVAVGAGGCLAVPAGAEDLSPGLAADPAGGRLAVTLPDGVPVVVRTSAGRELAARFEPLAWRERSLAVSGLLGDGAFELAALYTFEPDGRGGWAVNSGLDSATAVRLTGRRDALVVRGAHPEGTPVEVTYLGSSEPVTADPRRLEWSQPLGPEDVGRRFVFQVEALCSFPPPVGVVASAPAVQVVEVPPPPRLDLYVASAAWTAGGEELEVRFSGPEGLRYRVEAVTDTGGRTLVLADPAEGFTLRAAAALDGTPLPRREALRVRVRACFPHHPRTYRSREVLVPPLLPPEEGA